jgi:hypothetical protein
MTFWANHDIAKTDQRRNIMKSAAATTYTDLEEAYKLAEAALQEATGTEYSVDVWYGLSDEIADDESESEWLLPVYASADSSSDYFDAVADAGLPGWIEHLVECALLGQ